MVLHNYKCSAGHISEKWVDPSDEVKRCGVDNCRRRARMVFLSASQRNAQRIPPTLVFIDPTGKHAPFPALANDQPTPPGFMPKLLTDSFQMRKFAAEVDRRDKEENQEQYERARGRRQKNQDEMREMRSQMGSYTSRAMLDFAMEKNQRGINQSNDPGSYWQVLEYDRGSRERHYDPRRGWSKD